VGGNVVPPVPPVPPQGMGMTGVPQPAAPKAEKKKKGKAGLIVVLILLLLIIIACGVLVFIWMNRPINKIEKAFAAGDMDTVAVLYDELKSEKDIATATELAYDYADQLKEDFLSGEKDYKTVSRELDVLYDSILEDDPEVYETINLVSEINDSRTAFDNAEAYKEEGSYIAAMEEYAKVIEEDTANYELAQTGIEEAKSLFREDALSEAKSYSDNGDYETAIYVLEDALLVLTDDTELQDEIDSLEKAIYTDVVTKAYEVAGQAVAEGRYADALAAINAALEQYPDSAELQDYLEVITAEMYASSPLVGTWSLSYDFGPMLAEEMGEDFADFESSLPVTILLDFNEDGTCRMYIDEVAFVESFNSWEDDFIDYSMDIMYGIFKDSGYTKKEADALVKSMYGFTMEEYMRTMIEEELDMDAMLGMMESNGVYKIDGDKICMADTEAELTESSYDTFSVFEDTLTIGTVEDGAGDDILPGLDYPLVFTRVVETD
ncbi:MAG: hypothetical protein ACI4TB_05285, partial [Lachnospiraceae bacterium]